MSAEPRRPFWLPQTGPGNLNVRPECWGLTLRQWAAFIVACRMCTELWEELEQSTDGKEADYVDLYQIRKHFVSPWTKNTGNSVALLLNNEKPLRAQVMISHAWGGCIFESMVAVLGKASVCGMPLDTVLWFCAFSQYQPGDTPGDCGPSIATQLAMDPFKCVIASKPPYGMFVIHTSRAELYSRLWCVYEVNEAHVCGVIPWAAVSMRYLRKIMRDNPDGLTQDHFKVDCEHAGCFSEEDERMIKEKIVKAGGYEKLNTKIQSFRADAVYRMYVVATGFADWSKEFMKEDPQRGLDHLVDSVRAAASFIGLHCLTSLAEKCEDDNYGSLILQLASCDIELLIRKFHRIEPPPPMFNTSRGCKVPMDKVEHLEVLQDIRKFPFARAILEMGAGGNLLELVGISGFLRKVSVLEHHELLYKTRLKQVFTQWDKDGNGTISEEVLSLLLAELDPSFPEHDCKAIFRVLDKNGSGNADYNEFIDWLYQKCAK